MRTRIRPVALALAALLTTAPAWAAGPRAPARVLPSLDAAEADNLTYMREEEKLARDVYQAMDTLWQAPIFENIALSEQQHTSTVKGFLDKYSLPDPATPDEPGVYTDPALQQLYTDLAARGEASYLEALRVGGLIEEVDIADLDAAIAATDNADLKQMYGNLQKGSRNHLRAYAAEIERLGAVYRAQHLDQAAVDAIIDSPMERGGNAAAAGPDTGRLLASLGDTVMQRGGGGGSCGGQSSGSGQGGRGGQGGGYRGGRT